MKLARLDDNNNNNVVIRTRLAAKFPKHPAAGAFGKIMYLFEVWSW